mgnify:CR=1 FL=1
MSSFLVCAVYARAAGVSPLFGRRANLKFLMSRGLFGEGGMCVWDCVRGLFGKGGMCVCMHVCGG